MSIVDQYIIPIIFAVFGLAFAFFFFFGLYKLLRKLLPKELNAWLKYVVLRQNYPEEDVQWCMEAQERGADIFDVKRYLLLNQVSQKRIEEVSFIFRKLIKLKGGQITNGRQVKTNPLKTFSKERRDEEKEKN